MVFNKILLAVDLNHEDSWRKALPAALALCQGAGAELEVATVMPDFHMPLIASYFPEDFEHKAHAELERKLAEFVAEHVPAGVKVSHQVLAGGRIYERLIEFAGASKADLVVIAAYRPDLKDILLGPNAERVVRHAPQSVLVVRD